MGHIEVGADQAFLEVVRRPWYAQCRRSVGEETARRRWLQTVTGIYILHEEYSEIAFFAQLESHQFTLEGSSQQRVKA